MVFVTGWQGSADLLQGDHPDIPNGIGLWYGKTGFRRENWQ